MIYTIHKPSTVPAYIQLYEQLREDIIREVYPKGSKLPSKRLVADEVGISTITVEHAYALLADEGYIEPRQRSGYFVIFSSGDDFMKNDSWASFSKISSVSRTHASLNQRVNKESNSDFEQVFSYSLLAKTMRRVLNTYQETLLDKSPNEGVLYLRESIQRYLAHTRGIEADTSQIIIGSGSEYLYGLITSLLGRHRIYGIETPSYHKIQQVYLASGITYEMLPLGPDGIDSPSLQKTHADILHITPYRSFPSGVTASASKRHEYLRWASNNQRYIIEDDYESEFSVSKKMAETLFTHTKHDNVIYLNTFSQTISPALRVAYMVLPKHLVPVFREQLGFYSCTVPTFEQYVLAELLSRGDFERHINRVRRSKRKKLQNTVL